MAIKDVLILSTSMSQVATASGNSADFGEFAGFKAAVFYLNVTAFTGFTSVTFSIQERSDQLTSGLYFDPTGYAFTATTATGSQRLVCDPLYATKYRAKWTVSGSGSITFSLVAVMSTEEPVP